MSYKTLLSSDPEEPKRDHLIGMCDLWCTYCRDEEPLAARSEESNASTARTLSV